MISTLDDVIPQTLVNAVAATWPRDDWPHWHRYHDRTADKYATKDASRITDAAKLVIGIMAEMDVGCNECFPDLDLHGAGLHMLKPGGFLGLHLDGAKHPLTGWSRIANAVLFIDDWLPEWGGELQMCRENGETLQSVSPRKGRIAVFETTPTAWHRVTSVTGPAPRRTLSLFWWSQGIPDSDRDRALFA